MSTPTHLQKTSLQSNQQKRILKSPAFKKKTSKDIPRINNKIIPLHYTYGLNNNFSFKTNVGDFQWWADVGNQRKKQKRKRQAKSQPKTKSYSPSQHLFRQYMKNRPTLILTKRHDDQKIQEVTEVDNGFLTQLKHQSAGALELPMMGIYSPTRSSSRLNKTSKSRMSRITSTAGSHTIAEEEVVSDFKNFLVIRMSTTNLAQLTDHNFRINSMLQRKKRSSECTQYQKKKRFFY